MNPYEEDLKQIRRDILQMAINTDNGHIASALSCVEILYSLYNNYHKDKNRIIMSKGHGCLALYTMLRKFGYNPDITKLHPDIDVKNGIECTTGSLGHGLPVAVGMAMAKNMTFGGEVFVVLGDGELQEGTTWECLLLAKQHRLENLIIIVDYNRLQALDKVDNILSLGNLKSKLESFDCYVLEVDGHNVDRLTSALKRRARSEPTVIIANTVKGKGISFMENKPEWHSRLPNEKEYKIAMKDLK